MIPTEQSIVIHPETSAPLQTFARCYEQIVAGDDPWLPLGDLMHQFFGSLKHRRAELVADPIVVPENVTPEQWRWAVFCAASVVYLCHVYGLPSPAWAQDEAFRLANPWYLGIGAELLRRQEKLHQTTPEEFAIRNVFCGERVYWNKYEHPRGVTATGIGEQTQTTDVFAAPLPFGLPAICNNPAS